MLNTDDRDAIGRYIEAADLYFRELERPQSLFDKPFVPHAQAGYNVARLAYLLTHLKPGPGQTVLDFGAGMCWLSIVLARMGCRAVALDVSAAALRLGEEACRNARLAPNTPVPRLMVYDGIRFPLPDNSVDRIACYDAMHHVPNKQTVLREMLRVLRSGGLACFIEPGPGHAESPDSRHDTAQWGVLEDEVGAPQFCQLAADTGFAWSYTVPMLHPGENQMNAARFEEARTGSRQQVLDWSGNDAVIVLGKGTYRPDSRAPELLRARIEIVDLPAQVEAGTRLSATVRMANVGDTCWLAVPGEADSGRGTGPHAMADGTAARRAALDYDKAFLDKEIVPGRFRNIEPEAHYRRFLEENVFQGMVTLGVQLQDLHGTDTVDRDYARGFLPHDVAPGASCEVRIEMRAPQVPGIYALRFDMVDEYLTWFSGTGSPVALEYLNVQGVTAMPDTRAPGRLGARLQIVERPEPGVLVLSAENRGDTVWLRGPLTRGGYVSVGVQRLDARNRLIDRDWMRFALPRSIAPGESVSVRLDLRSAMDAGAPSGIKIDLVNELRRWFEDAGSTPLMVSAPF